MSIEENYLSKNNLTPETFEEMVSFRKLNFYEDLNVNEIEFVKLRITGGLNRVGMFFTDLNGNKFRPEMVQTYFGRVTPIRNETEPNGGGLHLYEDVEVSQRLGIEPMELCFYGYKGRYGQPSWDIFFAFWAYQGFENMIGEFEIKNLQCAYPNSRGNPEIVLETFFIRNGELAWKDWIREKLPSRNVEYKKWTF